MTGSVFLFSSIGKFSASVQCCSIVRSLLVHRSDISYDGYDRNTFSLLKCRNSQTHSDSTSLC